MSQELIRNSFPAIAATAISNKQPVALLGATSGQRLVTPIATANVRPFGIALTGASGVVAGDAVTVYDRNNYVKCTAGASLGNGADIGVASTNGALAPLAGASGSIKHIVGQSIESAAVGEIFSLYVNPGTLSGLQ